MRYFIIGMIAYDDEISINSYFRVRAKIKVAKLFNESIPTEQLILRSTSFSLTCFYLKLLALYDDGSLNLYDLHPLIIKTSKYWVFNRSP